MTAVPTHDRVTASAGSGDVPEDLTDGDGTVGDRGEEPAPARSDDDAEGQVGMLGDLLQRFRSLDGNGKRP